MKNLSFLLMFVFLLSFGSTAKAEIWEMYLVTFGNSYDVYHGEFIFTGGSPEAACSSVSRLSGGDYNYSGSTSGRILEYPKPAPTLFSTTAANSPRTFFYRYLVKRQSCDFREYSANSGELLSGRDIRVGVYTNSLYYLDLNNDIEIDNSECEGNPCNPMTGNKQQLEVDYVSSHNQGLRFYRNYNSLGARKTGGTSGTGWRHTYERSLSSSENIIASDPHTVSLSSTSSVFRGAFSDKYATPQYACESGWSDIKDGFLGGKYSTATSSYISDEGCSIILNGEEVMRLTIKSISSNAGGVAAAPPSDVNNNLTVITEGGTSYRFTENTAGGSYLSTSPGVSLAKDGADYVFTDTSGNREIYDSNKRLVRIEKAGGNIEFLDYELTTAEGGDDNPDTLDRVRNRLNQSLTFHYRDDGLLDQVTTPDGDISYGYDAGLLNLVTYPDTKTRQYHYEDTQYPSHLTGITDENGDRYATWSYNIYGKASTSEYAGGNNKLSFSYQDAVTTVTETTDVGKKTSRMYFFDLVQGKLKTTEMMGDPCLSCNNGDKKSREYDDNGFLDAFVDWKGHRTEYLNNDYGYPTTITQAVGTEDQRTISVAYHPVWHNLPTLITEPDRKTDLEYHSDGRLKKRIVTNLKPDPVTGVVNDEKRTTSYTYDTHGLLDTVDGPRTDVVDVTDYDFDDQGNLDKVTNALGHVIDVTEHDASGRPKQILDANSQLIKINYYPRGWIKDIDYAGALTAFEYDGMGMLEKLTLPNGVTLTHTYDAAHRLDKTTDGAGNYIDYDYDLMGNLRHRKLFDPENQLKNSLEQTYYNNGWLKEIIGASNQQTTTLLRDEMGNVYDYENPRSNSSTQVYDALNRLEQVTDAKNGITKYDYDTQGNLKWVEAPNGAKTEYEYNGFGERTKRTSPDTGVTHYTYTEAGFVNTETDARGITITNTYDALNRIEAMTASDGQKMTYIYDDISQPNEIGRLSRVVDNSGETHFDYDVRGNRTAETRTQGGISTTMGYSYNAADQLETMTYPSGHVVTYNRNTPGQVVSVTVTKDNVEQTLLSDANYLPFGPLKTFNWGNGQVYDTFFDNDYRLKSQMTTGLPDRGYNYDAADNVDDITVNGQLRDFGYDELERLEREQTLAGPVINYQYDGNGNRELSDVAGSILDDYVYTPNSNRLASIVGQQNEIPVHDAVGNLKQDSRFSYTYDAFGRLTNVQGEGQSIEYAYNARHQRVRKTVNGQNTYFQYDNSGRLLVEQDAQGQPVQQYIYLGLQPIGLLGAGQVGTSNTHTVAQLSGTNTQNLSETGTAQVTVGDENSLHFGTSTGYEVTANADELSVTTVGDNQRVSFNRNDADGSVEAILNINPANPASSNGYVNYQFDSSYSGSFNYPVQFNGNVLTVGASDGSEAKVTFNNDNTMTLEYAGRSETFTPNQRYLANPYGYFAVFNHNANGLSVTGFASGTYGSITITENRTLSGTFYLNGVATAGGNDANTLPLYAVHTDHLATIHAITDMDQNIVWQGEHDAFGQTHTTVAQINNPLRFPGQYFDAETGLHYNWHRYYNPNTGRYISSDPIGLARGINTFGYVGQNPINFIDSSGLETAVIVGGRTGGNPFGHVAIAFSGAGVYSYGTSTPRGSDLSNYLAKQAAYRDTTVILLDTSSTQEQQMRDYLKRFEGVSLPNPLEDPDKIYDTCASRTNGALLEAGYVDPRNMVSAYIFGNVSPFPADSYNTAKAYSSEPVVQIPKGGEVPGSFDRFNPPEYDPQ